MPALLSVRSVTWTIVLFLPLSVGFIGCSKSPMAHVTGKVLYKDGSVPHGGTCVVNFRPADKTTAVVRKGASGLIGADGSYDMWTKMPGDGIYKGDYDVSFVVWQSATDPNTSLIAPKYMSPKTSGYKVTVDKDLTDQNFEIEPLAAAGHAPAGRTDGKPAGPAAN